jgi:hypothetical protein
MDWTAANELLSAPHIFMLLLGGDLFRSSCDSVLLEETLLLSD